MGDLDCGGSTSLLAGGQMGFRLAAGDREFTRGHPAMRLFFDNGCRDARLSLQTSWLEGGARGRDGRDGVFGGIGGSCFDALRCQGRLLLVISVVARTGREDPEETTRAGRAESRLDGVARAGRQDPEETTRALSADTRAVGAKVWGFEVQVQVRLGWGFRCRAGSALTVALRGLVPNPPATVVALAMAMVARHRGRRRG